MKKVVILGIISAFCPLVAAHAVVLEQKWTPGQDLNYQTALRGTMNVQAPASANFILAGVPVDVEIRGDGVAQFKILSVDSAGVGTIAVRVPQFNLQGETWGQKGQMTLGETSSKFSLNGKTIEFGDGTNPINKNTSALRISRQGRVLGVQNLASKAPVAATQDDKAVNPADAINRGALMTAAAVRALPTLWPGRDIQVGESWQAQVIFPVASPADPKKVAPTQFGEWNLTLKGAETIGGKQLQRVGVTGSLSIDSAQFTIPTARIPRTVGKQDVSGDLWLDAAAGQIARADLIVGARVEGAKGTKDQSHADFTGTLQLNLKSAAQNLPIMKTSIFCTLGLAVGLGFASQPAHAGLFSISPDKERKMGQQAAADIEKNAPLVSGPVEAWVQRIGARLAAKSGTEFQYRFHVIDAPQINAFCLPGGHIFVYTGLRKVVKTDDELAAVLAHEITHAEEHHYAQQYSKSSKRGALLGAVSIFAGLPSAVAQGLNILDFSMSQKYSRQYETQADTEGLFRMKRAGFDPNAMVTVLKRLADEDDSNVDQWMSDHPEGKNRVAKIQALLPTLK